jgi:predicted flap endonuclease-1-like 5' DNA nuclease
LPRVRALSRGLRDRRLDEARARARPDLISAHEIGGRALKALHAAGITRWEELADATPGSLTRIPRIGPALAAAILAARADR